MIALPPPALVLVVDAAKPEVWTLDQLRIERKTDAAKVEQLAAAHSLADAAAILNRLNVPFVHARATLRPDRLPAEIHAQIAALPAGEPFVLPDGEYFSINVIIVRPPAPAAAPATTPSDIKA